MRARLGISPVVLMARKTQTLPLRKPTQQYMTQAAFSATLVIKISQLVVKKFWNVKLIKDVARSWCIKLKILMNLGLSEQVEINTQMETGRNFIKLTHSSCGDLLRAVISRLDIGVTVNHTGAYLAMLLATAGLTLIQRKPSQLQERCSNEL